MSDKRPIGAFDSGLGGLSVVRELQKVLPNEDIVYFGDTGRVPYGTKSPETIRRYAAEDEAFLLSKDVKLIIAACGTVSSVASNTAASLPVPFLEVVTPTCRAAVKATSSGRIGILGTPATVASKSYERLIARLLPEARLTAVACPLFVPLVENGWIGKNDKVAFAAAERYLAEVKRAEVDTLILGCTHFPLLADIIGEIMGDRVTLINSGKCAADAAVEHLISHGMLNENGKGDFKCYVSDRSESFSETASILLGRDMHGEVGSADVSELSRI